MSLTVGELVAYLRVNDADFNSRLAKNEKRFSGFGGKLVTIAKGAAMAAGLSLAALATVISKTVDNASALAGTMSKSSVVFGTAAAAVDKFGDEAARALGMSKQKAVEATATFGNLFVSMKMGQKLAANMSMGIVSLAGDLASFNNVGTADVLLALRAGLVGEAEPLRKFGINLNEASLQQKALNLGLWDGEGAFTAAAKSQAAYALIMEQSTTAQGDFARTSDGLANSQRIMAAVWENLQATLGTAALPAVTEAANWLADAMEGLTVGGKFDWGRLTDLIAEAVGKGAEKGLEVLSENIIPIGVELIIKSPWSMLKGAVQSGVDARANQDIKRFAGDIEKLAEKEHLGNQAAFDKYVAAHPFDYAKGLFGGGGPSEQQRFKLKELLGLDISESEIQRMVDEFGYDMDLANEMLADRAEKSKEQAYRDELMALMGPGTTDSMVDAEIARQDALYALQQTRLSELQPYVAGLASAYDSLAVAGYDAAAGLQAYLGTLLEQIANQAAFKQNILDLATTFAGQFSAESILSLAAQPGGPQLVAAMLGDPAMAKSVLDAWVSSQGDGIDAAFMAEVDKAATKAGASGAESLVGAVTSGVLTDTSIGFAVKSALTVNASAQGAATARTWASGYNSTIDSMTLHTGVSSGGSLPGHASGDIIWQPEVARLGEHYMPEVVYPVDNPARGEEMLAQVGLGRQQMDLSGLEGAMREVAEGVRREVDRFMVISSNRGGRNYG